MCTNTHHQYGFRFLTNKKCSDTTTTILSFFVVRRRRCRTVCVVVGVLCEINYLCVWLSPLFVSVGARGQKTTKNVASRCFDDVFALLTLYAKEIRVNAIKRQQQKKTKSSSASKSIDQYTLCVRTDNVERRKSFGHA